MVKTQTCPLVELKDTHQKALKVVEFIEEAQCQAN